MKKLQYIQPKTETMVLTSGRLMTPGSPGSEMEPTSQAPKRNEPELF